MINISTLFACTNRHNMFVNNQSLIKKTLLFHMVIYSLLMVTVSSLCFYIWSILIFFLSQPLLSVLSIVSTLRKERYFPPKNAGFFRSYLPRKAVLAQLPSVFIRYINKDEVGESEDVVPRDSGPYVAAIGAGSFWTA